MPFLLSFSSVEEGLLKLTKVSEEWDAMPISFTLQSRPDFMVVIERLYDIHNGHPGRKFRAGCVLG
jgi:hypothetical protein